MFARSDASAVAGVRSAESRRAFRHGVRPGRGRAASTPATMRSQRVAGESEDVDRRRCPCLARAPRAAARARGRGGCGRSRRESTRHAAVSSTVMSSTSRMTKTVRNATGSSSIRRSSMRRTSARIVASTATRPCRQPRRPPAVRAPVACSVAERHDDAVALLAAQPHQRLVDDDARQPGGKLRLAAEVADVPVGVEIGVLQRVLGLGVVPENRARDPEQPAVVAGA